MLRSGPHFAPVSFFFFFFFNDTATTEIYTLSLHDALPICHRRAHGGSANRTPGRAGRRVRAGADVHRGDRKSTRLNSSHANISYAVFCLKKKKHRNRKYISTQRSTQVHLEPHDSWIPRLDQ